MPPLPVLSAVPAIAFAAAALLSSLVGRAVLLKAALGVSKVWGAVVLFVPFGPVFFSLKYTDLAQPTRFWRMATGPLLLLFFVDGGTVASIESLADFGKPRIAGTTLDVSRLHAPTPTPAPTKAVAAAKPAPAAKPTATPAVAAKPAATPAPPATPSKAVAAANTAMPAAPKVLTREERMEANRREFDRLAEVYDNLKHERGYLRKGDAEGVEAYNAEVLKYQAALQLAKNEQAALSKLTATK